MSNGTSHRNEPPSPRGRPSRTSRRWCGGSASWRVATTSDRTVMNLTFEARTATYRSGASRAIDSQPGRIRPSAAGSSRMPQISAGDAATSTVSTVGSVTRRRPDRPRRRQGPRRAATVRCGRAGRRPSCREQGGADDPGVVPELGRDDRDPDGQERGEAVEVLAHAATQDEQARAEQPVDRDAGARRDRPPRPSRTIRAGAGRSRRSGARRRARGSPCGRAPCSGRGRRRRTAPSRRQCRGSGRRPSRARRRRPRSASRRSRPRPRR